MCKSELTEFVAALTEFAQKLCEFLSSETVLSKQYSGRFLASSCAKFEVKSGGVEVCLRDGHSAGVPKKESSGKDIRRRPSML